MNIPAELNLLDTPLDGRNLIEASAGTGKTYALTGLFLRLILEKKLSIGEILAVTFTEAAALELRGRIHAILHDAKQALEHPRQAIAHDSTITALVSRTERQQSIHALTNALRDFDSCAIFTIHGFCQRLLYEFAFESDQPLNAELIADQSRLVNEITQDFWRRHFTNASYLFSAYTLAKKITPAGLAALVESFVNRDDVRIIPETSAIDTIEAERVFLQVFEQTKALWGTSKSEIAGLLQSASLDGRKYGKFMPSLLKELDRFLASDAPDPAGFLHFDKMTARVVQQSVKTNCSCVKHSFFDVCESLFDASQSLCGLFDKRLLFLKSQVIGFMDQELAARKKRENVLYFDDLLMQVRQALSKKNSGGVLKGMIRKKFRALLIDEFQDTDPLQCGIFFDLFSKDTILFLIGDPKQAIYGFRGADIFAYLKASKNVDRAYTLSTNYRSEKKIVNAINALFGNKPNAFVFDDIRYRPIAPADHVNKFSINDFENSSFTLWFLNRYEDSSSEVAPISKSLAENRAGIAVAAEISSLLNLNNNCNLQFQGKKILPSQITVLVRTNREADLIYNILINGGITATIQSNKNVFETTEALDLYRLLMGITHTLRLDEVRAGLSSCYIGYNASEINMLNTNQTELDHCISAFNDYHEHWKNAGFIRMIRLFMLKEKVRIKLLSMPLGERKLTNFLHLVELIHQKETLEKSNPKDICKWMLNKILQDGSTKSDEEVLRLEKDDNAIRVMTLHKSKGLEFPIVFLPFAWEGSEFGIKKKNQPFLFHDPDDNYLQKIALGEDEINKYRQVAELEQLAENVRLLYVGLTRAKYRCYCTWGMVSKSETSAFAYLVNSTDETTSIQTLGARLKGMTDEMLFKEIQSIADNSNNSINATSIPQSLSEKNVRSVNEEKIEINLRDFIGKIPEPWQISSFSSLTHYKKYEDYSVDLEQVVTGYSTNFKGQIKIPENEEFNIFTFPKGKKTGLFLHDLIEHIDFDKYASSASEKIIFEKLQEYEFDSLWYPTINNLINNLMTIPLVHKKGKFTLSSINATECIREMEFMFPIKRISSTQLNDIIPNTELDNDLFVEKKIGSLEFSPVRGFVKGFIDQIFQHDGKYFIIDWKSNYLGDSIDCYNYHSLKEAITQEYYYFQYYIYLIALNEFLSKRLPEYDYNKHFGGVFYIFLRGIGSDKGSKSGIFFDKPDETVVNRLRECLIGKYAPSS